MLEVGCCGGTTTSIIGERRVRFLCTCRRPFPVVYYLLFHVIAYKQSSLGKAFWVLQGGTVRLLSASIKPTQR